MAQTLSLPRRFWRRWRHTAPAWLRRLVARNVAPPDRLASPNIADARVLELRENVQIRAYWMGPPAGPGPCASVIVHGDEVMRFDCLGPGEGHMHFNMRQVREFPGGSGARLMYREQDIPGQITRSCFELRHNLPYALRTNFSSRVRRTQLSTLQLERAEDFLRENLQALWHKHQQGETLLNASASGDAGGAAGER